MTRTSLILLIWAIFISNPTAAQVKNSVDANQGASSALEALNREIDLLEDQTKYTTALEKAQLAVKLAETSLGPQHPGLFLLLLRAANIHSILGNYQQALDLQKRALEIRTATNTVLDATTSIALNNIASSLQSLGKYEDALSYLTQALHIRENELGPDPMLRT